MSNPDSQTELISLVKSVVEVRSLPVLMLEAESRMRSRNASAQDVARILSSDPALAVSVLRLANSAYFGPRNRIGDLTQAIVRIGFQALRNLVLTVGIIETFRPDNSDGFDYPRFWAHSVATAIATSEVATLARCPDPEAAYVTGLLHDLGRLVIAQELEPESAQIRRRVEAGASAVTAEREILGWDHAELGARLIVSWNLPVVQVDAIRHHHDVERATADKDLGDALELSDILVTALGRGSGTAILRASDGLSHRLGYDEEKLSRWIARIAARLDEAQEFFALTGLGEPLPQS